MKKYLPLLVLPLLVSCGGQPESTEPKEPIPAVYCIRSVEETGNGTVLLDMPGYYHGQTDKIQEISVEAYESLTAVSECPVDDPRMSLEPSGIVWRDGRVTDLDGNILTEES